MRLIEGESDANGLASCQRLLAVALTSWLSQRSITCRPIRLADVFYTVVAKNPGCVAGFLPCHVNIGAQTGVCVGGGGCWCSPGGCSGGYVCERSGAAPPGLSWLLMTAIAWTSRTPSPPAVQSSSSSTTLTPGRLTRLTLATVAEFGGGWQHLGFIVSIAVLTRCQMLSTSVAAPRLN